jgi:hypothetical protein
METLHFGYLLTADETLSEAAFVRRLRLTENMDSIVYLKEIYYATELYQPDMHIGFELSGKTISCVADVPGSNFTSVSTNIIATFDSCKMFYIQLTAFKRRRCIVDNS